MSDVSSIGEIATLYDSLHKTPKKYEEHGYPMIRVTDVKRGFVSFEGTMKVDEHVYKEFSKKYKPQTGDIIFTRVGSYGNSCFVNIDHEFCLGQNTVCIAPDRKKVDPYYLYQFFNSPYSKSQIDSFISGSSQPTISLKNIKALKIVLPPIESQKQIADLAVKYDDLIENNKRRIELLEESVRQLYKEWFVRFRFPGHEHVKIIDGVPEGWTKTTYGEAAETVGGGTPSTKVPEYWEDGDVTWFVPKDLTNNNSLVLLGSEKKITKLGLQKSSAKMLPPNTIMMSSRASIGYFGLYDGDASTNQGFISVIPKQENTHMYLLHNLMNRKDEIIGLAGGTTYKEINKTTFRSIELLIPPDSLLDEFQDFASDLISQVRLLMKQIKQLTSARDILLPKLMNGEIAV